ncbi:MAG: type II toxin-antitoxin system VapC family toxin [Geminicoccaceae bacterium]
MVDASVVAHWLLTDQPLRLPMTLGADADLAAPHLIDAEVAHAIRRHLLTGLISVDRAEIALQDLMVLPVERYPHTRLLRRAFALRDNATIYDALYLALAEALGTTLLTRDKALTTVPGVDVPVEVVTNGTWAMSQGRRSR